jgi:hypothetical protein
MIKTKTLRKAVTVLFAGAFLIACEDEFSEIGTGIIGGTGYDGEPFTEVQIAAYSEKIEAVQTNGLPQYLLGAYDDPVYGLSEASILTQLSLSLPDPDFGQTPVLDSVVMVLPYYSTVTEQTEDGTTYELDSIYGSGPFKLSVFESNYFLRELDPDTDFEEAQLYYSNQMAEFEANLGQFLIEENVGADSREKVIFQPDDTVRVPPRLRVKLPVDFFQQKIMDQQGTQALLSNANFQSYFRGLYLKAEAIDGKGFMSTFNLSAETAGVLLYYTTTVENASGEDVENQSVYKLAFGGNSVNVYDNDFQVDLSIQDMENGEEKLYLKGGQGSVAVIELFRGPDSDGDGISDLLEELREKNWLINEANLIFYVDENLVAENEKQPERLFIYNLKDNRVLVDYEFDYSLDENDPLNSRTIHLGRLQTDENGNRYYKIRLTGHLRNLLSFDSTNVKLGLGVSSNVNFPAFVRLKDAEEETVSAIPATSVTTPEGTVLYGNAATDENKKLQLKIYFTKPE